MDAEETDGLLDRPFRAESKDKRRFLSVQQKTGGGSHDDIDMSDDDDHVEEEQTMKVGFGEYYRIEDSSLDSQMIVERSNEEDEVIRPAASANLPKPESYPVEVKTSVSESMIKANKSQELTVCILPAQQLAASKDNKEYLVGAYSKRLLLKSMLSLRSQLRDSRLEQAGDFMYRLRLLSKSMHAWFGLVKLCKNLESTMMKRIKRQKRSLLQKAWLGMISNYSTLKKSQLDNQKSEDFYRRSKLLDGLYRLKYRAEKAKRERLVGDIIKTKCEWRIKTDAFYAYLYEHQSFKEL